MTNKHYASGRLNKTYYALIAIPKGPSISQISLYIFTTNNSEVLPKIYLLKTYVSSRDVSKFSAKNLFPAVIIRPVKKG